MFIGKAGKYSDMKNVSFEATIRVVAEKCENCPAGSYSEESWEYCIDCSSGTYSNEGSGSCPDCPAGAYSLAAASDCIDCFAGYYSEIASSSCIPCNFTTYPFLEKFHTDIIMLVGSGGKYSGVSAGECTK